MIKRVTSTQPRLKQPHLSHPQHHYRALAAILLVGAGLRFLNLGQKPLWLDEMLTVLFSLGRNSADIPRETWWPVTDLANLLSLNAAATCAQITQHVATDSNHPPLFFCALHQWLRWLPLDRLDLVWAVRSLPALIGIACIAAMYWLGRVTLSPRTGLAAALLMAVSPFAVYLSQEARHYTLPMLLITLSLAALVQMQQDLQRQHLRWPLWLAWVGLSLLGLYVHYFVALAIAAQGITLILWLLWHDWQEQQVSYAGWRWIGITFMGLALGYAPWLPTFWAHLNRPEASWLTIVDPTWGDRFMPLLQLVMGWILMVVALPVEHQPLPIILLSGVLMLLVFSVIVWRCWQPAIALRQSARRHPAITLLAGFTLCMVLEFLAIVYGLGKDLTLAPRYSFVYYPGCCLLLGALLTLPEPWKIQRRSLLWGIGLVGVISSLFVSYGLAFQKPYYPDRVAQTFYSNPDRSLAVLTVDQSFQDVALGLSFAVAIDRQAPRLPTSPTSIQLGFIHRPAGYRPVWRQLAELGGNVPRPANLWTVLTPNTNPRGLPLTLNLSTSAADPAPPCQQVEDQRYRTGHLYQLYECLP